MVRKKGYKSHFLGLILPPEAVNMQWGNMSTFAHNLLR